MSNRSDHPNHPFYEVAAGAEEVISKDPEHIRVLQKWTCRACGERVTMSTFNAFHKVGNHEDCKVDPTHTTDIEKDGCNFIVIAVGEGIGQVLADQPDDGVKRLFNDFMKGGEGGE